MKKEFRFFLFVLFFTCYKSGYSQQPFLTVYYSYSEKSKDSHSTTEIIKITGITAVYTLNLTGRRGPKQKDEKKECVLTKEQVVSIRKNIIDNKLNVTDSLVDNSIPLESNGGITTLKITFTNGNKTTTTKYHGNLKVLGAKPLYRNSLSLLNLIKEMLQDCH